QLNDRRVETVPVSRLIAYAGNARTHSRSQIRQIAGSIKCFGFVNPVLADDADQIIAGHGRVEAAKLLGIEAVPVLRVTHLTGAEKRAYVLADNRLAELAGWDRAILAIELQGLLDVGFEVEATGFSIPDIDLCCATIWMRTTAIEFEAAAGSAGMIVSIIEVRKLFLLPLDCR
ncbi:MAG TPA: ParB/Srx family N-terminal domain-containing protein, partial [Bradyrhizobium sp.]|nr:ParB/Srx family N-terminal domain-containing protein [Bradyrhizobium sp.]